MTKNMPIPLPPLNLQWRSAAANSWLSLGGGYRIVQYHEIIFIAQKYDAGRRIFSAVCAHLPQGNHNWDNAVQRCENDYNRRVFAFVELESNSDVIGA